MDLQQLCCCWSEVCQGRGCILYRILFCPVVLPYHAIRIFCGACVWIYLKWWSTLNCLKGCCWDDFEDEEFPANDSSIGQLKGDTASGVLYGGSRTEWKKASEIMSERGGAQLFEGQIEAADLLQGAIGDCWLIAAMACVAERPEILQRSIRTKTVDARGKYHFRLWNQIREQPGTEWVDIVVDDFIPCYPGTNDPKFCKANDNEIWALLMEKAFAKMYGNYSRLEGGSMAWGLTAMTGNPAVMFDKNTSRGWRAAEREDGGSRILYTDEEFDDDQFFKLLHKLRRNGAFICCAGIKQANRMGLIDGHAYSIIQMHTVQKEVIPDGTFFQLVQIRNPHGGGEWQGAWSDNSQSWAKYPHIKKQLVSEHQEDGSFWMQWQDFVRFWKSVDVVDCETNIQAVGIPVFDEEHGGCGVHLGPVCACIRGCCDYWCCCTGFKRLYCGRQGAHDVEGMKAELDETCGIDQQGCFCNLFDKRTVEYDELSDSSS